MPPHCDTLDGPVVVAARRALAAQDVRLVLPYVHPAGEAEVAEAFRRVLAARTGSAPTDELLELWFFETVVRVHRAGEGAPYTGVKPAGLPVGPVIPVAEAAIESGDPTALAELLTGAVHEVLEHRFAELAARRTHDPTDVPAARAFVKASLGIQLWSHHLHETIRADVHAAEAEGAETGAGGGATAVTAGSGHRH